MGVIALWVGATCMVHTVLWVESREMSPVQWGLAGGVGLEWKLKAWLVWLNGVERKGHSRTGEKDEQREEFAHCFGEPVSRLLWIFQSVCVGGGWWISRGGESKEWIYSQEGWLVETLQGRLGKWRGAFHASPLWSFSLAPIYRSTVHGIHPPISLPFLFFLFHSTDIYYAPALC